MAYQSPRARGIPDRNPGNRLYILYDGRKVDSEGCREYIAKESNEHQIAAWIDANEPNHNLLSYTFRPSLMALALVDFDELRRTVADAVMDSGGEGLGFFNIAPLKDSIGTVQSSNRRSRFL